MLAAVGLYPENHLLNGFLNNPRMGNFVSFLGGARVEIPYHPQDANPKPETLHSTSQLKTRPLRPEAPKPYTVVGL